MNCFYYFLNFIVRAIINNDEFKISKSLVQIALYSLTNIFLLVIRVRCHAN